MSEIKNQLVDDLAEVEWERLRPHFDRDGLILVAPDLEILEAASAVADNDAAKVGSWLESTLLTKPDAEMIAAWDEEPKRLFSVLIVQPFVLFKEIPKDS